MTTSYQKSLLDLIEAMKGHSSIKGWDILVSYDLRKINTVLQKRAEQDKYRLDVPEFTSPYHNEDDPPNHDRSRKINITLEHPRLSLKDGRGGALLTFKFSGCYQRVDIKDQPKRDYPSNLELLLSTEVMSVSGTFNGHFEAGNHPKTSAHQVVLTDDAPSSTYGVVLVFPPGLTATVQNSPTGSTSSALLAKVKSDTLTNIQEYFESQTFQYHIAAISNSYDQATPGAHVLKPKAFSFSTIPESTNPTIPGALCIWIALEGSSNATTKKDRETTLLGFAPDGTPLTPIPMNNEASIIFDGETFNDLFLKPSMEPQWFSNFSGGPGRNDYGLASKFNFYDHTIGLKGYTKRYRNEVNHYKELSGCSFNMNTPEAFLGFSNSLAKLSPAPVVCQWSSSEQVMKWHEHDVTYAAGEVVPIDDYGTARATFSLKGQGHWVGPSDHAKAPNEIGLQLKLDNHFSTTITTDRVSWWAELFGGSSSLPDEYKDLSPPAPNFDIKIALNYFLTTNLILPGMWLFNADDPVGVDDNHGFALPQDAILTGKINDQLPDAIAERNKNLTDAYIRGVRLATATKAEKDIIQGVLSDPIHHIVGDLLRTISKSATGTGLDIIHSIGNSGYHGISSEVLLNAFGYSSSRAWEALCGFSALRTGSRHGDLVADVVVSSNPPDVRIFGGRYKILSVDVDSNASQTLIINPRSGEVTYEQKTSLPIISIDKATGQAWVLFTRGVQRFRMLFMAYLHGPTPVFTIAFEGTVVDDTGRQRPFCGRLDQHVNKIDDYIDNLGILNYNGFMITFISTIALCYLKYTEGKKSNALDEALQTNYSTLTRTYESFKDLVAEEAGRKFKESPALQLLIQGSRDKLRSSLAEAVREVLAKIPIDSSLYNFNPKLDLFPDRFFAVSAAADNVTEKVLRAGIGGVSYGVLDTVVQPQVHNNMLLPSDVDLVRTYATEAAIRSFKAKLAEPSGLCLSFLHASVALEILNWGIRKRSQELVDRATNVKALKKQQDTMQGELATLSELIIVEEERSRDRSLADDLREEAQELVAALQLKTIEREAELEEQEAQIKKLMNMVTVLENEQNEADKLKKEMENQQNNAEKRVFGT